MDNVHLDPLFGQPPRQPEPVTPGLERNCEACDGATLGECLVTPTVQQVQERRFVWRDFLQRLSLDPWYGSGDQPARLARFDNRNQGGILLDGDKRSA